MQKKTELASKDFEEFAKKTKDSAQRIHFKSLVFLSYGEINNALSEIEKLQPIMKSDEDRYLYFFGKGVILQHKGSLAEALSSLKTAVEFSNKDPKPYTDIAYICMMLKNPEEANKYAELCLSKFPYQSWAYLLKGNAAEALSNNDEAHICYSKALLIDKNEVAALMGNADLYKRQGDNERAILYSSIAGEVIPNNAAPFFLQGSILMESGDKVKAKQCFEQAIRAEPESNFARLAKEAIEKLK
jgi:tetratricopeptide (TPR) repeat protein